VTKQHNYFFVYSDTKIGLLENGKDIIERRGGGKEKLFACARLFFIET
jgi:hypothetical protein